MKLIDSTNTEVVLNESTTKLLYWGNLDTPAIVYFKNDATSGKVAKTHYCTIKKISALKGSKIVTDGGTQYTFGDDVAENIKLLETLLGCKIGQVQTPVFGLNRPTLPPETSKLYTSLDDSDDSVINVTVTLNAPVSNYNGQTTLAFAFPRSMNSVFVEDVVNELPKFEGYECDGLLSGTDLLKFTDKIMEDSELTASWIEKLVINVKKAADSDENVDIVIPTDASTDKALEIILNNETVKGWLAADIFETVKLADGSDITKKMKFKLAKEVLASGVALAWAAKPNEGTGNPDGGTTQGPDQQTV